MKIIKLIGLLFWLCTSVHGQNTFSNANLFGDPFSWGVAVAADESGIYVIGRSGNPPVYLTSIHVTKFDNQGEILWNQIYTIDSSRFLLYQERHIELTENQLIYVSNADLGLDQSSRILYFNKGDGELEKEVVLDRYFDGGWVNSELRFDMNGQGEIAIAQHGTDWVSGNGRFEILFLSQDDTTRYSHADQDLWLISSEVDWIDDEHVIASGYRSTLFPFGDENLIRQSLLKKIHKSGELVWEYIAPEYGTRDTLETSVEELLYDNGSIIYANSELITHTRFGYHVPIARPLIRMLNEDLEIEWTSNLGFDFYNEYENRPRTVVKSTDGNGYVVNGTYSNRDDAFEPVDTIIYETLGFLAKLDNGGELLWKRYYRHPHPDTTAVHQMLDLVATPDGGYAMTGEFDLRDTMYRDSIRGRTWLLKVDSFGCLIPGCQDIVNSTEDNATRSIDGVLVSPNPSSDQLIIYQAENSHLDYQLVNSLGVAVKEFSVNMADYHHILDVRNLPPGSYFLRILDRKNMRSKTEKLLISR